MKQTSEALLLATAQANCRSLCMSDKQFSDRLPELRKLIRSMTKPDTKIVSFSINAQLGVLDMLTKKEDQYYIHRFMSNESGWQWYEEAQGDAEDIMSLLLNKR